MTLEEEIFQHVQLDFERLEAYGFVKNGENYSYSQNLISTIRADIVVSSEGVVRGELYDEEAESEYLAFRIENVVGEFVGRVREKYDNLLKDIVKQCSFSKAFDSPQANRIAELIFKRFGDEPEFLWERYPRFGVFRNRATKKWYGIIMNITKDKLGEKDRDEVDVINLKLDSTAVQKLVEEAGMYPAYHMNKKYWISILLDDTLSDDEVMDYVEMSYEFSKKKR